MKNSTVILIACLIIISGVKAYQVLNTDSYKDSGSQKENGSAAPLPAGLSFGISGTLNESPVASKSGSRYWWLNSGGLFIVENGVGKTIQGEVASPLNRWRLAYQSRNPTDTDNGLHPQNLFRLFTKTAWEDSRQQVYFKINKDNLSASPNRNMSNGIFFVFRFKDRNNTYYAGVRVDGTSVIKKKVHGVYYTLDQREIWTGNIYDKTLNPSLLPKAAWIGMKNEVENAGSGKVSIKLFIDIRGDKNWMLAGDAEDNGKIYGENAITGEGAGGLRSDFMDIEFKDYKIEKL